MSDQEMQFAEPDWQPSRQASYARQELSPDARPTPERGNDSAFTQDEEEGAGQTAYTPYEEGYRIHQQDEEPFQGFQARQGQTQQSKRKRRGVWFWVLLIVILGFIISLPFDFEDIVAFIPEVLFAIVAVFLVFLFVRLFRSNASTPITETHTFDVAMQPRIAIKDDFGAIRVHSGEGQQVVIRTTKHAFGLLGNPANSSIQYEQNKEKNRINVKAKTGWHFFSKQQIDFDITVPRLSDLDIKTDAGSIVINGVNGQLACDSDAGSIKVLDAMLRGDSLLKTDAGSITFDGSLDPHGSYTMTTDAGSVNVTLPMQASFKLDAKTDVGSIHSDFPIPIQRDFPGAKARGEVGFPPYPTLKLRTDVGTINIRER